MVRERVNQEWLPCCIHELPEEPSQDPVACFHGHLQWGRSSRVNGAAEEICWVLLQPACFQHQSELVERWHGHLNTAV